MFQSWYFPNKPYCGHSSLGGRNQYPHSILSEDKCISLKKQIENKKSGFNGVYSTSVCEHNAIYYLKILFGISSNERTSF